MIRLRHLAAASAVALSLIVATLLATPVLAQSIVFDPNNYAQNVLTAARELQQINNQITALQNQAQMLINQARNLASLPYSSLQQLAILDPAHATASRASAEHCLQRPADRSRVPDHLRRRQCQPIQPDADRQRSSTLAELGRGPAGFAAGAGWRRRQSRHQPHPDVGLGDIEPVGDRRPCRQRRPATSFWRCRRSNSPISPQLSRPKGARRSLQAAQQAAAQDQGREQLRRFLSPAPAINQPP